MGKARKLELDSQNPRKKASVVACPCKWVQGFLSSQKTVLGKL